MKKNWGALGLLVLTVLVVVYTYTFEYKKRLADEEIKDQEALVLKFDKNNIKRIVVRNQENLSIENQDGKWVITSPVQDDVDEVQVKSLVDTLAQERADMEIDEDIMEPKIYGLDKPIATIEVVDAKGMQKVEIGGEAIQGKNYLRVNSGKSVIVSSGQWKFLAQKTLKDLRAKNIFRSSGIQSVEIEVPGKNRFVLKRDDKKWVIEGQSFALDNVLVNGFISQIENLKALDVAAEDQAQLNKWALDKPAVVLRVLTKDNKDPVTIRMTGPRNNNKDSFVVNSALKPVFKSYGALAETFVKKPLDFRDREEPLRYTLAEVIGVRTKASSYDYRFIKKGEAWYLEKPESNRDVDQSQVVSLLNSLQAARAQEYLGRQPFKAERVIDLLDKDGNSLLKLELGEELKGKNRRLAKSSKVDEVFSLDASLVETWPGETLVKEKANPQPEKEGQ